jgi:hypothetical protein
MVMFSSKKADQPVNEQLSALKHIALADLAAMLNY